MKIIISTSSMVPIYEQIVDQIRKMIASCELQSGSALPSVRMLAKDLKISALTVKKAYDALEEEGFVTTVHGKGTFVTGVSNEMFFEEQAREVERQVEELVHKAKRYELSKEELLSMIELFWEE